MLKILLSFFFDVFLKAQDHSLKFDHSLNYAANCKIFYNNISHAKYLTKYSKPAYKNASKSYSFTKDKIF